MSNDVGRVKGLGPLVSVGLGFLAARRLDSRNTLVANLIQAGCYHPARA